jgi:RNA-directed DNA polymerase
MQSKTDLHNLAQKYDSLIWKYSYPGNMHIDIPKLHLLRHEMSSLFLLTLDKPSKLYALLQTHFIHFHQQINNPEYLTFEVDKKKGGQRQINAPGQELKQLQKRFNYYLQGYYLCIKPPEVHGFVINPSYYQPKCNIVANALPHVGKTHILSIDLKDFFQNITISQVYKMFSSSLFNYNDSMAKALTFLTTFNGKLPTGAPTSPVIANFVCWQLDHQLAAFAHSQNLAYSRYADDLTFSSSEIISNDKLLDIINIIQRNGFTINPKKVYFKTARQKQKVTGIVVNQKINVDRKLLKKVRAMHHDFITNGIDAATRKHYKINRELKLEMTRKFLHKLKGYINFIGQVRGREDATFLKFHNSFSQQSKHC